jgi:hypothetical protein
MPKCVFASSGHPLDILECVLAEAGIDCRDEGEL